MTDCCFTILPAFVDEVQSNMTDNRNYKTSSLIPLLLIAMAMLILSLTSLSTSAVALPTPSSGSSYVSIADLQMGRMDNEIEDYSETGANNRHDPPPPTPTQP